MRDVSGRKIELDKIDDPSLEVSSSTTEALPDVPSIEEEEGALMKIRVLSLSRVNVGLHESANPRSGLGIMYSRSC
jgi:hypothetical protein